MSSGRPVHAWAARLGLAVALVGAVALAVAGGRLDRAGASAAHAQTPDDGRTKAQRAKLAEADALEAKMRQAQMQLKYVRATRLARRVLRLREAALGEDAPELVQTLKDVAAMEQTSGNTPKAIALYERVLALEGEAHGPDSMNVAYTLDALAPAKQLFGDLEGAEAAYVRSLAIKEAKLGAEDVQLASAYQVRAAMLDQVKRFSEAEGFYLKAMTIYEAADKAGGYSQAPSVWMAIAWHYMWRGDSRRAVHYADKVVAHYSVYEPAHPSDISGPVMLDALSNLFKKLQETERLETLRATVRAAYAEALERIQTMDPPMPSLVGMVRQQLAAHYLNSGEYAKALEQYEALVSEAKANPAAGGAQGEYALVGFYSQMGRALEFMGRSKEALALYDKSYAATKKAFGAATAASYLGMIATAEERSGRRDKALRRYRELVASYRKRFGAQNQWAAMMELSEARIHWVEGRVAQARKVFSRAMEVLGPYVELVLDSGTEDDKRAVLEENAHQLNTIVTFHLSAAPADPEVSTLAMATLLARKGRVLDAMADTLGALRDRMGPEERALLDKLKGARGALASHVTQGDKSAEPELFLERLGELESEVRALEEAVAKRVRAYALTREPVSLAGVQGRLPADAALVEIVRYQKVDPTHLPLDWVSATGLGEARYAAYVLIGGEGAGAAAVDLGPAAAIDAAVAPLRDALKDSESFGLERMARDLDKQVFEPVRALLGGRKRVLLAPDGALNLVPFGALVDERGRYLVERYTFSYLTSGRDLLRFGAGLDPAELGAPVIVADPAFDAGGEAEPVGGGPDAGEAPAPVTRGLRSIDLGAVTWQPLPGTAGEADAIDDLLEGVQVYRGPEATEGALKGVRAPRVLHVATHGFFLADQQKVHDGGGPGGRGGSAGGPPVVGSENPLLRSGLALAGANHLRSGAEDGVLTALEAAGLDLAGTKLVVLSACETGLGEIANGEGVYGLRRAFVLAGAESQVTSLWQVDDAATKDLMVGFYRALERGKGRAQALRAQQLKMLRSGERAHPFYWAAFVQAGRGDALR